MLKVHFAVPRNVKDLVRIKAVNKHLAKVKDGKGI